MMITMMKMLMTQLRYIIPSDNQSKTANIIFVENSIFLSDIIIMLLFLMRGVRGDETPFMADLCGRNLAPGKKLQQGDPCQSPPVLAVRLVSEKSLKLGWIVLCDPWQRAL